MIVFNPGKPGFHTIAQWCAPSAFKSFEGTFSAILTKQAEQRVAPISLIRSRSRKLELGLDLASPAALLSSVAIFLMVRG